MGMRIGEFPLNSAKPLETAARMFVYEKLQDFPASKRPDATGRFGTMRSFLGYEPFPAS
jgi:hypothetical protein